MKEDKVYNIKYRSVENGVQCEKVHRLISTSKQNAIEGLYFWKGATERDIISIENKGKYETVSG